MQGKSDYCNVIIAATNSRVRGSAVFLEDQLLEDHLSEAIQEGVLDVRQAASLSSYSDAPLWVRQRQAGSFADL